MRKECAETARVFGHGTDTIVLKFEIRVPQEVHRRKGKSESCAGLTNRSNHRRARARRWLIMSQPLSVHVPKTQENAQRPLVPHTLKKRHLCYTIKLPTHAYLLNHSPRQLIPRDLGAQRRRRRKKESARVRSPKAPSSWNQRGPQTRRSGFDQSEGANGRSPKDFKISP